MDDIRKLTGIIIDPGHGGTDSGATGNDMLEKDYTLLISEYMYDRFKELGVPVALTRNSDITLSPTERTSKILSEFGNNKYVIVISNHLNAGGGTGAEVIYALRNKDTLAKKILESLGAEGQTTRKYYQRRLPSDTSKDYYFIHRNTGVTEPLIVEYGFIDDKPENVEFLNENYQRLAEAVIRSVMDYKGLKYIPPEGYISNTYVVQKGDSLYSIARKLNTTVDELKRLNNLTSNTLSIGQILKLPKPTDIDEPSQEPTNITYTVQSGDSLYKIATKYNTTIDAIKKANNLTNDLLSIGQVLTIPTTIISEEVPEPNYFNYKVVSGDSLYKIAKKYNVTVDSIKELNNLTSNLLSIGQTIKIPTTSTNKRTYIVKSGDSLYSIAKEFNTTVDNLKKLNNLSSNMLSIGQILIIE